MNSNDEFQNPVVRISDLKFSFLLLIGVGTMLISAFVGLSMSKNEGLQATAFSMVPSAPTPPPGGGGGSIYNWGGMEYNYEWGALNFATGTFHFIAYENSSYNSSTSKYTFLQTPNFVIHTATGGAGQITSSNSLPVQIFWNSTSDNVRTAIKTADTVFYASDFFQSNTDNVLMTLAINADSINGTPVSGLAVASGNTVIDWQNIAELIVEVSGS